MDSVELTDVSIKSHEGKAESKKENDDYDFSGLNKVDLFYGPLHDPMVKLGYFSVIYLSVIILMMLIQASLEDNPGQGFKLLFVWYGFIPLVLVIMIVYGMRVLGALGGAPSLITAEAVPEWSSNTMNGSYFQDFVFFRNVMIGLTVFALIAIPAINTNILTEHKNGVLEFIWIVAIYPGLIWGGFFIYQVFLRVILTSQYLLKQLNVTAVLTEADSMEGSRTDNVTNVVLKLHAKVKFQNDSILKVSRPLTYSIVTLCSLCLVYAILGAMSQVYNVLFRRVILVVIIFVNFLPISNLAIVNQVDVKFKKDLKDSIRLTGMRAHQLSGLINYLDGYPLCVDVFGIAITAKLVTGYIVSALIGVLAAIEPLIESALKSGWV